MLSCFKNLSRILLGCLLCSSIFASAGQFKQLGSQKVYGPRLGAVDVFHKSKKFFVKENGIVKSVQNAFVDQKLRNIPTKSLNKFLKKNYLAVKKMNDGEYSIGARVRGLGGGPIAAGIGYWLTKAVCYGTAALGATTLVVTTGGAAVGFASGVAATSAAGVATAAAGSATIGAAGAAVTAATGATLVAGGAAGAAGAVGFAATGTAAGAAAAATAAGTTAAGVTVAGVSAAGGVAAAMGAIESAALSVGAICAWLPTP